MILHAHQGGPPPGNPCASPQHVAMSVCAPSSLMRGRLATPSRARSSAFTPAAVIPHSAARRGRRGRGHRRMEGTPHMQNTEAEESCRVDGCLQPPVGARPFAHIPSLYVATMNLNSRPDGNGNVGRRQLSIVWMRGNRLGHGAPVNRNMNPARPTGSPPAPPSPTGTPSSLMVRMVGLAFSVSPMRRAPSSEIGFSGARGGGVGAHPTTGLDNNGMI